MRNAIKCLQTCWQDIESSQKGIKKSAGPKLVHSEADMAIRVVRDIFNEDFEKLVVSGDEAWGQISNYVEQVAPDLSTKLSQWASNEDIFAAHRIDEQLAKAIDRKSTRLNSSHVAISYAVFCLKKKNGAHRQ